MHDVNRSLQIDRKFHSHSVLGHWTSGFGVFLALVIAVIGCAPTEQAGKVKTSGFINDYSLLHPGEEGQALLVYKNPHADFSSYQTIYVEPVILLLSKQSSVSQEEQNKLGEHLRSKVIWKLKEDFLIVPKLIPGALRMELALTEAVPSDVGMDIVNTLLPPVGVLSDTSSLATGTRAFVGRASVEVKISDVDTGTLLAAAVDRRGGNRTLDGSMDSWDDVEKAFEFWATKLSQQLRDWRDSRKLPLESVK